MSQSWDHLLFAHWVVPFNKLRAVVPPQLELDSYEGNCYVGVVPFAMRDVRPRYSPSVPWLSNFLELNLRTYVKDPRMIITQTVPGATPRDVHKGDGGVYFFSLDCSNPVAVEIACKLYHLPYYNALMGMRLEGEIVHYESVRRHAGSAQIRFKGSYKPAGPVTYSQPGSLEAFLTERYCLLLTHNGVIYRGDIHHKPWPLQAAEAEIEINMLGASYGFDFQSTAPILHYSKHIETIEWPLRF